MSKVKHKIHYSKLKLARIRAGISQQELSDRSGVPVKSIGNLEQLRRDINRCRVDIVFRLAQALDCSMEDLLDLEKVSYKKG
jgi:transcriptional regulator with XRE-family HTH domain|uniref:Helix-turn-helix domain protein n=1 Tax=Caudovirales sp. ctaix4 TaxID=2827635 RepID=A0A8S5S553_9CAUD|nr:MAG: helix-turn-helix domain protein [Bacteriophage sp.]DAF46165.1 MAG TPA: helix-turn-helix domain protein [Caudovirales sp. ctaix4]